jgi:uroporphyrinogen-III decarboxylase
MITLDSNLEALREEVKRKTGKTPEAAYAEKEQRIRKAINLEKPDRVPIITMADPSDYTDVPRSAGYYDPVTFNKANRYLSVAFDTDTGMSGLPSSGYALELLDVKTRLWPGGNLPSNYEYQFLEGEYMKADEYDIFFADPTDFTLRYYLPRVYGLMAPLKKLPYMGFSFNYLEGITPMFDTPEFEEMGRKLAKAGRETKKFRALLGNTTEEMESLGYPAFSHFGPAGGAPYDTVSSFLRGMQGAMTDMFRQPEKLLKLCDMIQETRLAEAQPANADGKNIQKRLGMPLWRGDKSFMSQKHFEKFYWPGLKKQLTALVNLGYVPIPVFEDEFGDRLECLKELPKGKIVALVDYTDVFKVSKMLKGHQCVMGGGPLSHKLMSIQEVEDYNKRLIDECAYDGGFILSLRLPVGPAMPELQGMIERLKEYARY